MWSGQFCRDSFASIRIVNQDFYKTPFQDLCVQGGEEFYRTPFRDVCGQDNQHSYRTLLQPNLGSQDSWNSHASNMTISPVQVDSEQSASGVACVKPDIFFNSPVSSNVFLLAISEFSLTNLIPHCNDSLQFIVGVQGDFGLHVVGLHERAFASGVPNYIGLRTPLPSKLNIAQWRSYLTGYYDKVIVDYLSDFSDLS